MPLRETLQKIGRKGEEIDLIPAGSSGARFGKYACSAAKLRPHRPLAFSADSANRSGLT
jgi:hypothetical protein